MPTNPNFPVVVDQMDVTNDPTSATTTWTDLTAAGRGLVKSFSCHSGRTYELGRTDTGIATVQVENSDGRFDPTNTASVLNSAGKRLLPMRRYRRRATWDGVTYDVWTGFVERYPQGWVDAGFRGSVAMTCVDALAPLSRVALPSLYRHEVQGDSPLVFVPLDDGQGATAAGVVVAGPAVQPMPVVQSKHGGEPAEFGADPLTADGETALALAGIGNQGSGLTLRPDEWGTVPHTIEMWLHVTANPTVDVDLFRWTNSAGRGLSLTLDTSGIVMFFVSGTGSVSAVAPESIVGAVHHVVARFDFNAGAGDGTATLLIDGVEVDANTNTSMPVPPLWQTPATAWAFGTPNTAYISGRVAKLALYEDGPTNGDVADHYAAGLGFAGDGTGTRAGRFLDAIGWPAAARDLDTGESTVGDYAIGGTPAAQALFDLAEWEAGNLFIAPDGKVTFRERSARFNAPSLATFGDGPGEFPYEGDILFDFDNTNIYNDVQVERVDGATVRVTDDASADTYFPSTLPQTVGIDSDAQTVDRANYLLGAYKDPHLRCERITIRPSSNAALWPQALGRKIGDRITVKKHAGPAPDISADFFIEAVDHHVPGDGTWTTTYALSPAGSGVSDFWVLEDNTFGWLEGSGANVSYPLAY